MIHVSFMLSFICIVLIHSVVTYEGYSEALSFICKLLWANEIYMKDNVSVKGYVSYVTILITCTLTEK